MKYYDNKKELIEGLKNKFNDNKKEIIENIEEFILYADNQDGTQELIFTDLFDTFRGELGDLVEKMEVSYMDLEDLRAFDNLNEYLYHNPQCTSFDFHTIEHFFKQIVEELLVYEHNVYVFKDFVLTFK